VIVAGQILLGQAGVREVDRVGEVEHVAEGELDGVDDTTGSWPVRLDADGMVALGDRPVSLAAQVDGGDAGRIPPGAATVLLIWWARPEHVPPCRDLERSRGCALKRIQELWPVDHELYECAVAQLRDQREDIFELPTLDAIGRSFPAEQSVRREQP
jgi:hypothetical protein